MKAPAPRRARQYQQEISNGVRDQKRERILEVAEELFFKKGYAGTTIADIVDRLGVTKPYLYYYFRNKDEIFETLCWRASVACLTALHFESSDTRPASERLREGLRRFAHANVVHFKSGSLFYRERMVLQPGLQRKLRALARRFYEELCGLLEEGRRDGELDFDNSRLTGIAIGSVAGFMYTWYDPEGMLPPEEMIEQLTGIMLKIAGTREKKSNRKRRSSSTNNKKEQ